ncbi:MAG: hypothetical protein VX589_13780 [Myxococcota bacterium]|nr:hypothetical protein [Myxococcota bacterium]
MKCSLVGLTAILGVLIVGCGTPSSNGDPTMAMDTENATGCMGAVDEAGRCYAFCQTQTDCGSDEVCQMVTNAMGTSSSICVPAVPPGQTQPTMDGASIQPSGTGGMPTAQVTNPTSTGTPMPEMTQSASGGMPASSTIDDEPMDMPANPTGNPNAMWSACPSANHQPQATSIYALKSDNAVADEQLVSVEGVVTARRLNADGLYSHIVIQVSPTASDYTNADHSGLWVYLNGTEDAALQENPPKEGALVRVHGLTDTYFDQRQINQVVCIEMVQEDAGVPAPVEVQAADVGSGADATAALMGRGAALEGVLIRVVDTTVTNTEPAVGPGDGQVPDSEQTVPTYEFVLDNRLRVNDFIYRIDPQPAIGDTYRAIVGVLRWGNANLKIEPRRPADVQE